MSETKKIVYLPLDERPCNYNYPSLILSACDNILIVRPPKTILGLKKRPADISAVNDYLVRECADADYLILSLEMLVYGGLVPSRLHSFTTDELIKRLETVKQLKSANKKLKIYAFSLIMRCPTYNSADEEPDYYEYAGKAINRYGQLCDKSELSSDEAKELYNRFSAEIDDFMSRREKNFSVNLKATDYYGEYFDALIYPKDDCSEYGFTQCDRKKLTGYLDQKGISNEIPLYCGADEAGCTLTAKAVNDIRNTKPSVHIIYFPDDNKSFIPPYEDSPVSVNVPMHIRSAGCNITDDITKADIVFFVNTPKAENETRDYTILTEQIKKCKTGKKTVAITDAAVPNGSDPELIEALENAGLSLEIDAYAGWNTEGNSTGTAIAQAVLEHYGCDTESFLALRYYEDAGYCAHVRKLICEKYLPELGLNYFDSGTSGGKVAEIVKRETAEYIAKTIPSVADKYVIKSCRMPWTRMFETELIIERKQGK